MLLALKNSVYIWQSNFSKEMDKILEKHGYTLITLPWETFELLENDQDHFTQSGYEKFLYSLGETLLPYGKNKKILILSDSTIGYWNTDSKIILQPFGICAMISCCGVGYTTHPVNFRSTIWDLEQKYDIVVMIGGWNDCNTYLPHVDKSVRNFTRTIKKKLIFSK